MIRVRTLAAAKALSILKDHLKMIKPIAMRYHEKMEKEQGQLGNSTNATDGAIRNP